MRVYCSRGSLTPVAAPNVSPNDFFERWTGCVEVVTDPCLEGCGLEPCEETGAIVPGYSGGLAAAWLFCIWVFFSRGSLTPVAAPNDF
jgi:hypothetical protein